jgi:TP901 family phage tail tape measure protein
MASFSVQYIFNLVDRFTPGAGKLGSAAKAMSRSVHSAGNAANAAAAGVTKYGAAAAAAATKVERFNKAAHRSSRLKWALGGIGAGMGMMQLGRMGRSLFEENLAFQTEINNARALMTKSVTADFEKMEASALQFSQRSVFGATEIAKAYGQLGAIGYEAAEAINIMPTIIAAAQASREPLDKAAETLIAIKNQFGLKDGDLPHLNDVIAKTAGKTQADLADLRESFKMAGPMSAMFGLDVEETASMVGLLSQLGIKGSLAGTGFRRVQAAFGKQSKETMQILKGLGLNPKKFFDKKGQFKDFMGLLKALEAKGITASQAMKAFGDRGGPILAGLLSIGTKQIEEFTEELRQANGEAQKMADEQMKGLPGAWKRLQAMYKGLQNDIGSSGFNDKLEGWMNSLSDGLKEFTKNASPEMKTAIGVSLLAADAMSNLAIPLAAVVFLLSKLGAGTALRMFAGLMTGLAIGSYAGVKSLAHMFGTVGRVAGPMAAAALAMKGVARVAGKMLKWYVVFEGIQFFWDNWEKIKAVAADPLKFNIIFPNAPDWLKNFFSGVAKEKAKQRARWAEEAFAKDPRNNDWMGYANVVNMKAYKEAQRVSDEARKAVRGKPHQQFPTMTVPDRGWLDRLTGSDGYNWDNPTIHPGLAGNNAAAIPQSMAPVEVRSHTSFDPASLTVTYNGPIQGPGSVPINAKPARGVSAGDAGQPAGGWLGMP